MKGFLHLDVPTHVAACNCDPQVCREADGYQPHLVSPEFGLRRLVQDAMDLIMEPTTTAVRRVHLLLVEAARRAAHPRR